MVELYWESHLGIALDGVGDGSEDDHDDGELHPRIGSRVAGKMQSLVKMESLLNLEWRSLSDLAVTMNDSEKVKITSL